MIAAVRYVFVDCRFDLLDPAAAVERYRAGHVPGAAHLNLDSDLSDLTDAPAAGRHPLPTATAFAAAASRAGIGDDALVVAYDEAGEGGAARLWWLLRHFGHEHAGVLDRGVGVWRGPLATGDETPDTAVFVPRVRDDDLIDADEVLERLGDRRLVVIDSRAPARFAGEPSDHPLAGLDPVAGHIPGAVNVPFAGPLAFPPAVLEADEIAVYCGSGVTACVNLLALHHAGRPDARLYPGSWSEWSRRGLPGETGN